MAIYNIDLQTFQQTFIVSNDDKLEYGEIYTPFSLIDKMLDLFDPDVFTDPNKRWLDVGAGLGYFSIKLFERLNNGLLSIITYEKERKEHIIKNMLHMVEIKETNVHSLQKMFGASANIIHVDFLSNTFHPDHFDFIIGNPPYNSFGLKKVPTNTKQKKKEDGSTSWPNFVIKSLSILKSQTGQLCMIIPSIWLKPDKANIHKLLTQYKIEKIHCFSGNETNAIFNGEAQTPTCFFLLKKRDTNNIISLYDKNRKSYIPFTYSIGKPIPLFGQHIIQKLQAWVSLAGHLNVIKTNMPSLNSKFIVSPYDEKYPHVNISTCVLENVRPTLMLNYSNSPQAFHGVKKIVMAHKMHGFPFFDKYGIYGISNRDNYIIVDYTDEKFEQLQAFLSTNLVRYVFESTRYRMKYLEKYAFELLPDITRISNFPMAKYIDDKSVEDFFEMDILDRQHIKQLHRKEYKRFI